MGGLSRIKAKKQLDDSKGLKSNTIHKYSVKEISINNIEIQNQPRKIFRNIKSLSDNLKETGLSQPIVVMEHKTDSSKVILLYGERRYHALKKAGEKTIPAIIKPYTSDKKQIFLGQIDENEQRDPFHVIEKANNILLMHEHFSMTREEICKRFNLDDRSVRNYLRIAKKLSEKEQSLLLNDPNCTLRLALSKITIKKKPVVIEMPFKISKNFLRVNSKKIIFNGKNKTPKEEVLKYINTLKEIITNIEHLV